MLKLVRNPKRSPYWYLRGTVRGQVVFETTGTDDRQAADALRIKREAELLERSVFGPTATITFAEAVVSYLEAGGEARFLGQYDEKSGKWSLLIGHFGSTPIAKIGQHEVDQAAWKLLPKAGPATRKRHVYGPMCAVLNHAAKRRWCNPPIIEHPKVPRPETKWSSPDRLEELLPHCKPALRRLVMVLVYTGARLGEALRIDWDKDVSLPRRTITIRRTKNGKMRTASIAAPLLAELSTVPEGKRQGPMFHWSDKTHVYGPLRRACKKAGVEYLPPHQQGRHTFATWLRIYAGRDIRGLMADGGWDSVNSVVRYLNVVPGETAAAVELLPAMKSAAAPAEGAVPPVSADLRARQRENKVAMKRRLERAQARALADPIAKNRGGEGA